jgi:phage regulator Rha-like protein
MFRLSQEEQESLRSQFVTLKRGQHSKYLSFAFTEQGVAMLSSVLNSERAVQVNIQIMRVFTKLRQMLATHDDLRRKIEEMEQKYDQQFQVVFDAIKLLLEVEEKPKPKIGFTVKERGAAFRKKILGLLQISRLQGRGFLRRVKKKRALINSRDATPYYSTGSGGRTAVWSSMLKRRKRFQSLTVPHIRVYR